MPPSASNVISATSPSVCADTSGDGNVLTVWYSGRHRYPKFHLDRACEGHDNVRDAEWELTESYDGYDALAANRTGRPCRMCALEIVLTRLLAPRPGDVGTFATFTAQGNPVELLALGRTFSWDEVTPSAAERLRRICTSAGLATLDTPAGPVGYGFVPQRCISILRRNLRVHTAPLTEMPAADVVTLVWNRLNELRPANATTADLDGSRDSAGEIDPGPLWAEAVLLASDPAEH